MGMTRGKFVVGGVATLGVLGTGAYLKLRPAPIVLGFEPDPDMLTKAKALIARYPSFDLHAHPGLSFARNASNLSTMMKLYSLTAGFEDKAVADMQAGGMNAVTLCTVVDFQLLELVKGKGLVSAREFEPSQSIMA